MSDQMEWVTDRPRRKDRQGSLRNHEWVWKKFIPMVWLVHCIGMVQTTYILSVHLWRLLSSPPPSSLPPSLLGFCLAHSLVHAPVGRGTFLGITYITFSAFPLPVHNRGSNGSQHNVGFQSLSNLSESNFFHLEHFLWHFFVQSVWY